MDTRRLHTRLMLMVARAVLKRIDDSKKMQELQVSLLDGEVRDGVERFQNYGFTSYPKPGAEAVVVFAGGNRDHGLTVVVDDRRYRLKSLAEGEVAMFSDEGDSVVLKRGRVVEVTTSTLKVNATTKVELNAPVIELNASTKVKMTTPVAEATGTVQAAGDITDRIGTIGGSSVHHLREVYNSHNHNNPEGGVVGSPNQLM